MECYEKAATVLSIFFQFIGLVFLGVASTGVCLIGTAVVIIATSAPVIYAKPSH